MRLLAFMEQCRGAPWLGGCPICWVTYRLGRVLVCILGRFPWLLNS